MSIKRRLLVFGCGKMSQSLLEGMGLLAPSCYEIYFFTPGRVRAAECAKKSQGFVIESLEVLPPADLVLLAMKPQQFSEFAKEVCGKFSQETTIFSVLAATSIAQIAQECDVPTHQVIRLMPNTPCLLSAGVIPYYSHAKQHSTAAASFLKSLEHAGLLAELTSEDQLDLATPYSGSGPGLLFEFARLWSEDLIERGVDKVLADKMIRATFLGSAQMMAQSSDSLEQLRDDVTSKNGVTAAALKSLEENQLSVIIKQAMNMALKRNQELKNPN